MPKTVDVEELIIRESEWAEIHVSLITVHKTLDIAPDALFQTTCASAPIGVWF